MMNQDTCIKKIQKLKSESGFLASLSRHRENRSLYTDLRPLTESEIKFLKQNGNISSDWSKLKVVKDFTPERIRHSQFCGNVVLGGFSGTAKVKNIETTSGIFNSLVVDSTVGNDAFVKDVSLLSNFIVEDRAVVMNCGSITAEESAFCVGARLPIAIETGGREVRIFPEITVEVAEYIAGSRHDAELLKAYDRFIENYTEEARVPFGVISAGATVMNIPRIKDSFIGAGAVLDAAAAIDSSILLASPDEPAEVLDGAWVKGSIIQWGSEVATMGIVDNSVLVEHSHVERHGKVTDSLLGPNTGVAEGEVTASLVGPFVGFHHQSLLIAAYWPEGKGNVGYGANVGSNHTSKAPDQELWAGEGTFFGLGVNIKFPSDFSEAPYSIIATAVNALPQRVEFPFSLINTPAEFHDGISPAFNEIIPAWVLSDNIFTIKRNEGKYMKRNKARRSELVFEVFRPDIIDKMIRARRALNSIQEEKPVYTAKDIPGLGKNFLKESARQKAIETYTFYLKYYALNGLFKKVQALVSSGRKVNGILNEVSEDARWEHERGVLNEEMPDVNPAGGLKELGKMQDVIAGAVLVSKQKDDKRGARIIKDYPDAHSPAEQDSFVRETQEGTAKLQKDIETLLPALG